MKNGNDNLKSQFKKAASVAMRQKLNKVTQEFPMSSFLVQISENIPKLKKRTIVAVTGQYLK